MRSSLPENALSPAGTQRPKWFALFLLVFGINGAWALSLIIYGAVSVWNEFYTWRPGWHTLIIPPDYWFEMALTAFCFLYSATALFPLLQQKRWGWIVAFSGSLIFFMSRLMQFDVVIRIGLFKTTTWPLFLFPIPLTGAFALYLLRKATRDCFWVAPNVMKITLGIAAGVGMLVAIIGRITYLFR